MPQASQVPLICLAGPTASGKTAVGVAVAQAIDAEIISVDSALVYRGMDIGTAKPSVAERGGVPHHLIDVRTVTEPYSAADFARDASRLVDEIRQRGHVPLLVGGTMLYFKALLEGLHDLPAADAAVRERIAQRAAQLGWPALHAELAAIDPATAQRLAPNDSQRIGRALEVWEQSGKPLSAWFTDNTAVADSGTGSPPRERTNAVIVSLEPDDRAWLHARIAQRFDAMLAGALVDEVRRFMTMPGVHADLTAMRAVGYRQAWSLINQGLGGAALNAALREQGIAATRQLAKRQLTWLRGMTQRQRVSCDAPGAAEKVLALCRQALAQTHG